MTCTSSVEVELMPRSPFTCGGSYIWFRCFQVRAYLNAFADAFDLKRLVRFSTKVLRTEPIISDAAFPGKTIDASCKALTQGPRWRLFSAPVQPESETSSDSPSDTAVDISSVEVFDALVVCNGHYTEPRLPHTEGEASSLAIACSYIMKFSHVSGYV